MNQNISHLFLKYLLNLIDQLHFEQNETQIERINFLICPIVLELFDRKLFDCPLEDY